MIAWRWQRLAHVLLVDDDAHIREVVRFALEKAGHRVSDAADGREALERFEQLHPDLIILDIIMPEDDGLQVCRKIRATSSLPIIFLSSRDDELDRVLGLELGADDYVTKPFSPRELVARVAAVLRRAAGEPPRPDTKERLQHGELEMDLRRHTCTLEGKAIVLTVTEFALLQVLMAGPGRVLSRAQLVQQAYGDGHYITERTVDSHVRRIRKKLDDQDGALIETVYGVGYKLRE